MTELSCEERLAMLVDREIIYRGNRRLECLLRAAKRRVGACVEDIDYRRGFSARYLRMPCLFEILRIAHGDGSYSKLMHQHLKADLRIPGPGLDRACQKLLIMPSGARDSRCPCR